MSYGVVIGMILPVLAMVALIPSTVRAVKQRRVIRRRTALIALRYSGEVAGKSPSPAGAGAPFGMADDSRFFDLAVRRDDGTMITVSMPIGLDHRFPVGCRVVKSADHLWPVPADALARHPNEDQSV